MQPFMTVVNENQRQTLIDCVNFEANSEEEAKEKLFFVLNSALHYCSINKKYLLEKSSCIIKKLNKKLERAPLSDEKIANIKTRIISAQFFSHTDLLDEKNGYFQLNEGALLLYGNHLNILSHFFKSYHSFIKTLDYKGKKELLYDNLLYTWFSETDKFDCNYDSYRRLYIDVLESSILAIRRVKNLHYRLPPANPSKSDRENLSLLFERYNFIPLSKDSNLIDRIHFFEYFQVIFGDSVMYKLKNIKLSKLYNNHLLPYEADFKFSPKLFQNVISSLEKGDISLEYVLTMFSTFHRSLKSSSNEFCIYSQLMNMGITSTTLDAQTATTLIVYEIQRQLNISDLSMTSYLKFLKFYSQYKEIIVTNTDLPLLISKHHQTLLNFKTGKILEFFDSDDTSKKEIIENLPHKLHSNFWQDVAFLEVDDKAILLDTLLLRFREAIKDLSTEKNFSYIGEINSAGLDWKKIPHKTLIEIFGYEFKNHRIFMHQAFFLLRDQRKAKNPEFSDELIHQLIKNHWQENRRFTKALLDEFPSLKIPYLYPIYDELIQIAVAIYSPNNKYPPKFKENFKKNILAAHSETEPEITSTLENYLECGSSSRLAKSARK